MITPARPLPRVELNDLMIALFAGLKNSSCCVFDGDCVCFSLASSFSFAASTSDDIAFFAIDLSKINDPESQVNLKDMGNFEDLMALSSQPIESGELAMLGQAKAVFEWHNSHTYCSRCGEKSIMVEGGYKRVCNNCKAEHFPRTDPVVIMLATYNDNAFLGRQKRFPPGMYSALAGFIEPGESIEEAVARELNEEAGIIINNATK